MHQTNSTAENEQIRKETLLLLEGLSPQKQNLIPILQAVQAKLGYIPKAAMQEVGSFLNISSGEVYGVATFYNQFRFIPPGKHPVKVCLGTACHVRGGNIILEEWERRLQIKEGEVTQDREFSLDRVACVGCCALAPVVVIGEDEIRGNMSPSAVDGILLQYEIRKNKSTQGSNENL